MHKNIWESNGYIEYQFYLTTKFLIRLMNWRARLPNIFRLFHIRKFTSWSYGRAFIRVHPVLRYECDSKLEGKRKFRDKYTVWLIDPKISGTCLLQVTFRFKLWTKCRRDYTRSTGISWRWKGCSADRTWFSFTMRTRSNVSSGKRRVCRTDPRCLRWIITNTCFERSSSVEMLVWSPCKFRRTLTIENCCNISFLI